MHDVQIKTDESSLHETIKNFIDLVEEIPWENSDWQNRQTIINRELTPERAYRHASRRIDVKLQALNECYYNLKKEDIQIERLRRKAQFAVDDLDKREAEAEIDFILSHRPRTQKLIKDAIREIESLAPILQSMGKLTREQFEAGEEKHFLLHYTNQAMGKSDSIVGLESMGINVRIMEKDPKFVSLYDHIRKGNVKLDAVATDGCRVSLEQKI